MSRDIAGTSAYDPPGRSPRRLQDVGMTFYPTYLILVIKPIERTHPGTHQASLLGLSNPPYTNQRIISMCVCEWRLMRDESILSPSYVLSELYTNGGSADWWRDRIQQRINSPCQAQVRKREHAVQLLDEPWSTLIVLDACRVDLFRDVEEAKSFGELETVRSVASSTPEWLKRTFGSSHGDTVYVAGNPMVTRHKSGSFHDLLEPWRHGYDPEESVIKPEAVTDAALDAHQRFPDKRLIVHYMQPHYPFIGHPELNYANYDFDDVGLDSTDRSQGSVSSVWEALRRGMVDKKSVWEGYRDNLRAVIPEVQKLVSNIDDQTIITSDHGNVLGERSWPVPLPTYGHPDNLRLSPLIDVPLVRIDGEIRSATDDGTNSVEQESTNLHDRLADLGYV